MKTFIFVFVCLVTITSSISSWGLRPPSQTERYSVLGCGFPASIGDFSCEIGQTLTMSERNSGDCEVIMLDNNSLKVACNNGFQKNFHCGLSRQGTGKLHLDENSTDVWTCS